MATKPAYATGAQVEHTKFGLGSVLSCNEEYVVIKFDEHGEKKFVAQIVLPVGTENENVLHIVRCSYASVSAML